MTLPAGYTGPVQVSCGSVKDAVTEVTVDASGNGQATFCPHVPASLVVLRGGAQIPVENDPSWSATGDGIPNGVRFNVK